MTPAPISIGAIEVQLLRDGADRVPPELILAGAEPEQVAAVIRGRVDADGQLPVVYNGLLIRTAAQLVLVDAGYGRLADEEGSGGQLLDELRRLGVAPTDVGDVVISHAHADHIGGLTRPDAQGRHAPIFSAARHWLSRDEWEYWTSESALAAMPSFLAEPARETLPPLAAAGLVELVSAECEVAPGVRIIEAGGHTPGHVIVGIDSGGENALYLGDVIFHDVNVLLPEPGCEFDVDIVAAAKTRRRVLELAAHEGCPLFAAHLGAPGRVEAGGGAFRLLPY